MCPLYTPNMNISFEVIELFPFISESKYGYCHVELLVQGVQKGADVMMARIVQRNNWLEEECKYGTGRTLYPCHGLEEGQQRGMGDVQGLVQ